MAYSRKLFAKLKEQAKERKISFLLGARQVGKTTLLKTLYQELAQKKKCLFLDLDLLSNYEKVSTFEVLLNTLKLQGYEEQQKDFFYLFLDEFQRYPEMARIMKNVYDNSTNIKIYASGSSSLTIKDQIQESLAGRKRIQEIFPLDFEEFLLFKGKEKLAQNLKSLKKLQGEDLYLSTKEYAELLKEFLIFGSYPEVTLKNTPTEKREVLESIFDLYVKKDLVEYLKVEKILGMKRLIEFLAVNNGQKIKYEEISALTSLSFHEIKKHLEILKETYLIEVIRPFSTNKNKELVKIPKIYFVDCGVRNFFLNNFNDFSLRDDAGFLFESFVLSELLKRGIKNIAFWQDKNRNEVDFILENNGLLVPMEIKYKSSLKSEDFKGLKYFSETYQKVKKKYLINLGIQKNSKGVTLLLPYVLEKITEH